MLSKSVSCCAFSAVENSELNASERMVFMYSLTEATACTIPLTGVLGGHEGHTTKSCCPLRFTLLISRKS